MRAQALDAVFLAARVLGLGYAITVEQHLAVLGQSDGGIIELAVANTQRHSRWSLQEVAVSIDEQRPGVPGVGVGQRARNGIEHGEHHGDEPSEGQIFHQHAINARQHRPWTILALGKRAH